MNDTPFWESKRLDEMTPDEWESLCDGCGLCCLHRFEDEDDGSIIAVPVACHLLDVATCRCTDYKHRQELVPMCIQLEPSNISDYGWLPDSCAYRRLARGKSLPLWHHLITGSRSTCHESGPGIAGKVVSERDADPYDALLDMLEASDELDPD